jgi:hypothetical protein
VVAEAVTDFGDVAHARRSAAQRRGLGVRWTRRGAAGAGVGDIATSAAGRQMVVAPAKASAGQVAPLPVQVSATSHGATAARRVVPGGTSASEPQAALVPLQASTRSQTPTDALHTVLLGWN